MNIYAPHRGKSTEDYLAFLQEVSIARADMEAQFPDGITIIMGDYNAELGKGKEPSLDRNNETVWGNDHGGRIGAQLPGRRQNSYLLPTEHGSSLLEYCSIHDLVVANSFAYDDDESFYNTQLLIGTWTRCGRNELDQPINQTALDHTLISPEHKDKVLRCGILPETAALTLSDHRMIFIDLDLTVTAIRRSLFFYLHSPVITH